MPDPRMVRRIWLLASHDGVVGVSPTRIVRFGGIAAPGRTRHDSARAASSAGVAALSALAVLDAAMLEWLVDCGLSDGGVQLNLDSSLDDGWHAFDWEALSWNAQAFAGLVQVVRYARADDASPEPGGRALVLYQWPREEREVFDPALKKLVRDGHADLAVSGIDELLGSQVDLSHYRALVVIAHGSAQPDVPLLDARLEPWQPPLTGELPSTVWLVACTDHGQEMLPLVRRLMRHRVRTVVYGHGHLSAPAMANVLASALAQRDHEAEWLDRYRITDSTPGGARALRVAGVGAPATEAARFDALTLEWLRSGRNPIDAIARDLRDDDAERSVLADKLAVLDRVWDVTRDWLMPYLLRLAERHDHGIKAELQQRFDPRAAVSPACAAMRASALARAYRRDGLYAPAAAQIASGLGAVTHGGERLDLLGTLVNVLIDVALPQSALTADEILRFEFETTPELLDHREQFKQLDRTARVLIRHARGHDALDSLARKRHGAHVMRTDDTRELAALTYAAAWHDAQSADQLASEVEARLAAAAPADIGHGNDTVAYLVRALACCYWRRPSDELEAALERWLGLCVERLVLTQDPGPFALALFYWHAVKRTDASAAQWARARNALEHGRYWLELAACNALLGDVNAALSALHKAHAVRAACVREFAKIPGSVFAADWTGEAALRYEAEKRVLVGEPSRASLARAGLAIL